MAEIVLSTGNQPGISIDGNKKQPHSELKNLGFDESGHTGFQKELTPEALEAIASVYGKEDRSNKVSNLKDVSDASKQYPTVGFMNSQIATAALNAIEHSTSQANDYTYMKVSELEKVVSVCGDFELVDSGTLQANVLQITPTVNGRYKELYWVFDVPTTNSDSSSADKARLVFSMNGTDIHNIGGNLIDNYNVSWRAVFDAKMTGRWCHTQLWFNKKHIWDGGYASPPSVTNYNGSIGAGKKMTYDYIDNLTVKMISSNGTRVLPAGTTYELWGVKA